MLARKAATEAVVIFRNAKGDRELVEFLGVSTQRVDQLALAGRFPAPSGRLGRARYWERSDVEAWAEGNWWAGDGRRWRHRR